MRLSKFSNLEYKYTYFAAQGWFSFDFAQDKWFDITHHKSFDSSINSLQVNSR